MIYEGSRYAEARIITVRDKTAAPAQAVYPRFRTRTTEAYIEYVSQPGDRFDILALRFLTDPTEWWRIADLNPEFFYPEEEIPPGSVLRIPRSGV